MKKPKINPSKIQPKPITNAKKPFHMESKERTAIDNATSVILNVIDIISIAIFNYLRLVGIHTIRVVRKIKRIWLLIYKHILSKPIRKIEDILLRFTKLLIRFAKFVTFKIYMFIKFFFDARDVIVNGYNKDKSKNTFIRLLHATAAFFSGVFNNRRIFITWLNYALPVAAIIGFSHLINYTTNLNFAVEVQYNNEHLGYIQDESVFEQAEAKFQQRVIYLDDDDVIDNIPKFTVAVVAENKVKDDLQLADALTKVGSKDDVAKATGVYVDDIFFGAVEKGQDIKKALDDMKAKYKTPETLEVNFTKDVQLVTGLYRTKNIKDEELLVTALTQKQEQDAYVKIQDGDTPITLAASNDLSLEEFTALNPGILASCVVGRPVLVKQEKSFLPVAVTKSVTYSESVPFKTNYTESTSIYNGMESVKKYGKAGEEIVTAKVSYVDGIEIKREPISRVRTLDPVNAEIVKGTGGYSASGSGTWWWPTSGGYVSSGYGGGRNHKGIDYATKYGTPVTASAAGKVISAGFRGSFGNLVKIDHGGGVTSLYAHNSKVLVREGQFVEQGQQIARIGSTGRSTGNHCHFEIHINGVPQNPMKYLK